MKNTNKILFALVFFMFMGASFLTIYATGVFDSMNDPFADYGEGNSATLKKAVARIWYTVKVALQLLSVGIFVFAGVKYMFAAPEQKADIKKSLGGLVVGAAIAFGSITVIDLIVRIAKELM